MRSAQFPLLQVETADLSTPPGQDPGFGPVGARLWSTHACNFQTTGNDPGSGLTAHNLGGLFFAGGPRSKEPPWLLTLRTWFAGSQANQDPCSQTRLESTR